MNVCCLCAVDECSVRSVADMILGRSQTHLEQQFAEHKRRLARLDELRSETDTPRAPDKSTPRPQLNTSRTHH